MREDIAPNSVWTALHRPKCDPSGMAYLGNGLYRPIPRRPGMWNFQRLNKPRLNCPCHCCISKCNNLCRVQSCLHHPGWRRKALFLRSEKAVEADQEAAATEGTAAADTETTTNNNQTKHTILTLSKAIAADAATIGIPAEVTFYDRLGITEEEVEQMKGELA